VAFSLFVRSIKGFTWYLVHKGLVQSRCAKTKFLLVNRQQMVLKMCTFDQETHITTPIRIKVSQFAARACLTRTQNKHFDIYDNKCDFLVKNHLELIIQKQLNLKALAVVTPQ